MEVKIANEDEKLELIVNQLEALKKKWRGKLRGNQTTIQYLEGIREGSFNENIRRMGMVIVQD